MDCDRCRGLLVEDSIWSLNNDFLEVHYMRCVNCGHHEFIGNGIKTLEKSSRPRFPFAA